MVTGSESGLDFSGGILSQLAGHHDGRGESKQVVVRRGGQAGRSGRVAGWSGGVVWPGGLAGRSGGVVWPGGP